MTLNEIILENIQKKIPAYIRPVKYLMDILAMEKEAAYRRVRNTVPFTFEEVVTIARDLNLSIDNIAEQQISNHLVQFNMEVDTEKQKSAIYFDMLQSSLTVIKELCEAGELRILVTINRIPWKFLTYPMLFKYDYYYYMHSNDELSIGTTLSDLVVPREIIDVQKELAYYFGKLSNISCVLDSRALEKTLQELWYYYKRKSFSYNDLQQIKSELYDAVEQIAQINLTGQNAFRSNYRFFLSNQAIDTNCASYIYDGNQMEQIWIYSESPIIIHNNPTIAKLQKQYIKAQLKYSTPLTLTNDLLQMEFYETIKKSIEDILPDKEI
ncbi:MAG: hypothetical protein LBN23_02020 [Paludibacter sp.]|jgi:hypothetical protein|nr:hypothetical protein [Paludibacter sp.]